MEVDPRQPPVIKVPHNGVSIDMLSDGAADGVEIL
jgi:hypothetical protein